MTKSAMNNNKRTKPFMTNAAIKKEAYKAGYKYTGYSTWECEACKDEMELAMQAVGYTGTKPAWANAHIALKFHKKGSTVVACKCGWRKDVTINFTAVEKRHCMTEGCNVVLAKDDPFNTCYRCRNNNPQVQGAVPINTCHRKGCNNPLPKGRNAVCYDCRKPSKKEAANNNFPM